MELKAAYGAAQHTQTGIRAPQDEKQSSLKQEEILRRSGSPSTPQLHLQTPKAAQELLRAHAALPERSPVTEEVPK